MRHDRRALAIVATSTKYALLILFATTTIAPFLWVALNSFKNNQEIYMHSFGLPSSWMFENYRRAWTTGMIGTNFLNTVLIAGVAVFFIILIASMAGHVIARYVTGLVLLTYFTVGLMVPGQAIIVPQFVLFKNLGLLNTRSALILAMVSGHMAFSIFVLVGFFKGIPRELEEAAVLDGCSRTGVFFRIVLPVSKAGLATIGIFAFLGAWNEYLTAFVLISRPAFKVITQGLMALRDEREVHYGLLFAGLSIAILPVLVVYLLFQKQVIKGLTAGAVKG